ncbi:MAG TPA: hypothetical protein VJ915_02755, partial [Balneolaceae bacterium]|nr:hypothetical protein [Balneolaceae bacterium]
MNMKLWILSVIAGILLGIGWAFLRDTSADLNTSTEAVKNDDLENTGISPAMESAVDEDSLLSVTATLDQIGPISSILISQDGEIVAEEYFGRMNTNRTHNIKSASKSVLSILIGIAIEEGYLQGVDQQIGEFFPDYFESKPDSAKMAITIG